MIVLRLLALVVHVHTLHETNLTCNNSFAEKFDHCGQDLFKASRMSWVDKMSSASCVLSCGGKYNARRVDETSNASCVVCCEGKNNARRAQESQHSPIRSRPFNAAKPYSSSRRFESGFLQHWSAVGTAAKVCGAYKPSIWLNWFPRQSTGKGTLSWTFAASVCRRPVTN